jgi:uncharacterized phiE125 gp8 family phage protein
MSATLLVPPAQEPVTVETVRAFLRLDDTGEDDLLALMITSARMFVEGETGLTLVSQTWRFTRDQWPLAGLITLPFAPVQSLVAVKVVRGGAEQAQDLSLFTLDGKGARPRLAFSPGSVASPDLLIGGISFDVVAGFGAADAVPGPLSQAVLRLVAHWFENRLPAQEAVKTVPPSIAMLYAPYAVRRL